MKERYLHFMRYVELVDIDANHGKVHWPFAEHKVFAYFCLNTMQRLEAV
jgi:hypothetical protein